MTKKYIKIEAESIEEARMQLRNQLPEGFNVASENIDSDTDKTVSAKGFADTIDAAFAMAQDKISAGIDIVEKKKLIEPMNEIITIDGYDEQTVKSNAELIAKNKLGDTAAVRSIKLMTSGRKGFLGVGKKPNKYEVEIFCPALVEVIYRVKPKITFTIVDNDWYFEVTGKDELVTAGDVSREDLENINAYEIKPLRGQQINKTDLIIDELSKITCSVCKKSYNINLQICLGGVLDACSKRSYKCPNCNAITRVVGLIIKSPKGEEKYILAAESVTRAQGFPPHYPYLDASNLSVNKIHELIKALNIENESIKYAASKALKSITGQDFGVDSSRWEKWYNEYK